MFIWNTGFSIFSNHITCKCFDFLKVSLSNPAEFYSFATRSFILRNSYTKIQITPSVKKINWDLRLRSPEIRKCYLHDERKLSIFQRYNEVNCNHECVINETISTCGCIEFDVACTYIYLRIIQSITLVFIRIRLSKMTCI